MEYPRASWQLVRDFCGSVFVVLMVASFLPCGAAEPIPRYGWAGLGRQRARRGLRKIGPLEGAAVLDQLGAFFGSG